MERHIPLEGISNFRDLGGYRTADGRTVKWRSIFRSDTLALVTEADMETICGLGVTAACDLRYGEERDMEPSRFQGHDRVRVLALGLDARPGPGFVDSFESALSHADLARQYLMENYRHYPLLYGPAYKQIFDRLAAGEKLVIHCTAGKDRAGTAAAMVLTALGVPRETVFEDYLLTNRYWDPSHRILPDSDPGVVAAIYSAHEEYLATAFEAIESRFGSIDAYFATHVGLDDKARAALQDKYLD
ncbi:tyrosine-protein phosphatase [Oceanibacterium hippocampi]|uniref:Tyrosine-protein phosphatase n=1 Tax=Oceanibacterium hippocampi TaxID=745714 RepID=A0A1Y5ST91_9PROT|nr:tyrosine-protein phosphatase [Oceanibacterium hippocampi]SLN44697.1 Tyrosine-protein phosphatase precursor [Oceanibacterium hippocampi]